MELQNNNQINPLQSPDQDSKLNSYILYQRGMWLPAIGIILLVAVVVGGLHILNNQGIIQKQNSEPQTNNTSSVVTESPTTESSTTQELVKPVTYQKTPVTSPDKFGFTKLLELKGIGVKAKFPLDVNLSFQQENFYVAKVGQDTVTFELKNYDGGGRRAWFQKEYQYYKDYTFITFNGINHSGYIAYSKTPQGSHPGSYFYLAAINSKKMLVIHGTNDINGTGIFFGGNLDKFKSFLTAVELISGQNIVLETYPKTSDLYRWSDARKTVWEDANLGLKITAPEWTESRYTRERDAEGQYTYTDWARVYPEAKTYDSSYFSENIKRVEITGAYISSQYLSILSSKYQGKSFSEVVNELLVPAGFCTTEWKSSKTECAGSDYCYTRDEVMQNLIVKKQVKIDTLDAQLRNMNQDFSNKNDCRAEDTWLIKAKNGQFILSNISPEAETIRVEGI